jgi:hypothetical protein
MSGRIRSIKPELLEDAVTAGLSDMAFRLFIGCILLADDYGNLRFEPAWLRGQVYWSRDVDSEQFSSAVEELSVVVTPYEVKGQRYGAIKNWAKHQKVSHPGKPRVPGLAEALPRVSGGSRETLLPDLRSPISDHRSPITDQRPPREEGPRESTNTLGGGDTDSDTEASTGSGSQSHEDDPGRVSRVDLLPTPRQPTARLTGAVSADPANAPPSWWDGVLETVGGGTGVHLPGLESWLRYAGHRASKGWPADRGDAVHWLTTVMVKEAREKRDKDRQQRDRDAKWDRQRSGPEPAPPPSQKQAEAMAEELRKRIAARKGAA